MTLPEVDPGVIEGLSDDGAAKLNVAVCTTTLAEAVRQKQTNSSSNVFFIVQRLYIDLSRR